MTTKLKDFYKRSKECVHLNSFGRPCAECKWYDRGYSVCALGSKEWNKKDAKDWDKYE